MKTVSGKMSWRIPIRSIPKKHSPTHRKRRWSERNSTNLCRCSPTVSEKSYSPATRRTPRSCKSCPKVSASHANAADKSRPEPKRSCVRLSACVNRRRHYARSGARSALNSRESARVVASSGRSPTSATGGGVASRVRRRTVSRRDCWAADHIALAAVIGSVVVIAVAV